MRAMAAVRSPRSAQRVVRFRRPVDGRVKKAGDASDSCGVGPRAGAHLERPRAREHAAMGQPRILVVDANRSFLAGMRTLAGEAGIDCLVAERMAGALTALASGRFDLIYVGATLADGDGLALAAQCRQHPRHEHTPIYLLTTGEIARTARQAAQAGITELVARTDRLQIRRHLERCGGTSVIARVDEMRALVFDDERASAVHMVATLTRAGFTVSSAADVDEAVAMAEAQTPDLVVLGVHADGAGVACARAMRERLPALDGVPVLPVLGPGEALLRPALVRLGVTEAMHRPFAAEAFAGRAMALAHGKRAIDRARSGATVREEAAMHDPLTGARHRCFLEHAGPMQSSAARRHGFPIAMLLLAVDGLDKLCQAHGADAGDAVLAAIGDLVVTLTRREDIVARQTPDTFALLLAHCDLGFARAKAHALRERIAVLAPRGLAVTASVGVASDPDNAHREYAELLASAEAALARAQAMGGNRVVTEGTVEVWLPQTARREVVAA